MRAHAARRVLLRCFPYEVIYRELSASQVRVLAVAPFRRLPEYSIDVPLRVVPNGAGSEVLFTLFQQSGMSDAQYAADAALVQDDLDRLKHVLEGESRTAS